MSPTEQAQHHADELRRLWRDAQDTNTREQVGGIISELTSGEQWRSMSEMAERALEGTRSDDGGDDKTRAKGT